MENLMDVEYWYNEYKKSQQRVSNLQEIINEYHKECTHLIEERDFYKNKCLSWAYRNGVL